jgi:hypothetical protein
MFTYQRQGFWTTWEACEEFDKDDHIAELPSNCSPPSFCVTTKCHEGYTLILQPGDETYAKFVRMGRALSQPNFTISSLHFHQIQEYHQPIAHNEDVIHLYIGWDINHTFRWRVDLSMLQSG